MGREADRLRDGFFTRSKLKLARARHSAQDVDDCPFRLILSDNDVAS